MRSCHVGALLGALLAIAAGRRLWHGVLWNVGGVGGGDWRCIETGMVVL